ncbi:MAG TPA: pyridoxal-phosphate dependent enzyme, partial [Steroidobacteraceae bacterium]|nr:pyridoxal-phosphate dependent enzyme [Steroidobacteraceae bacterium]
MFAEVKRVSLGQIEAARARIKALSVVTPLVGCDIAPPGKTLRLKLENLQPIGSFKIRPIANAVLNRNPGELSGGIYTTSSGNSGLGCAWIARRLGLSATAIVPSNAPQAKLERLRQLGARIE